MTQMLDPLKPENPHVGSAKALDMAGSRPLDVLIMTSEAPPIVSGISTCIERLASGLSQRGHTVRVLSSAQIPRLALGEFRLSSFLAYWPRIARELRNFDVVNVHGPVPTMSDAFLRLSDRLPTYACPAIVYTHHSPIDIRGVSRMSAQYNKLHDSLALRADRNRGEQPTLRESASQPIWPSGQSYSLGSRRAIVATVPGYWAHPRS